MRLYAVFCLTVLHLLVGQCAAAEGLQLYEPRCSSKPFDCNTEQDLSVFLYEDGKCLFKKKSYGVISIHDPKWPRYYKLFNCTKSLGLKPEQTPNVYNALVPMLDGTVDFHNCESLRLVCRNWTCPSVIPSGRCLDDRDECYRFLTDLPERAYSSFCWDAIVTADKKEMLLQFDHPIYEYFGFCRAEEMVVRRQLEFLSDVLQTEKRGEAAREAFCGNFQQYMLFFYNKPVKQDTTILIDIAAYGSVAAMFLAIGGIAVWNYWSAGRLRNLDRQVGLQKRAQMRDHYGQKIKLYVEQHKKEKDGEHKEKEGLLDEFDRLPDANAEPTTGKTNTKSGKKGILKVKGKKTKSGKRSKTTTGRRTKTGKLTKASKSKGTTGRKKKLIRRIKKRSTTTATTATGPSTAAKASATATTGQSKPKKASMASKLSKVSTAKAPTTNGKKATGKKPRKPRTVKFCSKSAVAYRKVKAPKRRKGKNGKKGKKRVVKFVPAVPAVHPNAAEIQKKLVGTYRPPIYEEPVFEQKTQESERRSDGKREPIEQKTQEMTKRHVKKTANKGKKGTKNPKAKKVTSAGKSDVLSEMTAIDSEIAREKSVSTKAKTHKKRTQTKGKAQKPTGKDPLSEKTCKDVSEAARKDKESKNKDDEKKEAPKKATELSEKTAISQSRTVNAQGPRKHKDSKEQGTQKKEKDVLSERTAIGSESRTAKSKGRKNIGKESAAKGQKAPQKEKKELLSEKTAVESEARAARSKGTRNNKGKKAVVTHQKKAVEKRKDEPLSEKTAVDSERASKKKLLPRKQTDKHVNKKADETVVAKPKVTNEKKSAHAEKHKEVPKPRNEGSALKKSAEGHKEDAKMAPVKQDVKKGKEEKTSAVLTASKPKSGVKEATTPAPKTAKTPVNKKKEAAKTIKKADTSPYNV